MSYISYTVCENITDLKGVIINAIYVLIITCIIVSISSLLSCVLYWRKVCKNKVYIEEQLHGGVIV